MHFLQPSNPMDNLNQLDQKDRPIECLSRYKAVDNFLASTYLSTFISSATKLSSLSEHLQSRLTNSH